MLERFADVPHKQPDPNDTHNYSKYAVKMLLRALLDDGSMGRSADATLAQFCEELRE
jgi:hypothetical protein